ncbi:MAG: sugar transferase [Anaerolineales bacterium]|jgi:exopolysaccharide biosynthesis polyprenyl glycosylphosphotransferase
MANHHPTRLRLRPNEHRVLLFVGDLLMATASVFAAIYTWREYQRYVLAADGFNQNAVERLLENIDIPVWFYLLPLAWLLLMVELYEPHTAANWRKTIRGIAIAAFVGLTIYSLVFIIRVNPNALPRIGVGAFLLYSSILTLLWRSLYIRFYASAGQLRHFIVVGAGKAGYSLAEVYHAQNPPPFNLVGFIDDDPQLLGKKVFNFPIISQSFELLVLIDKYKITDIAVAISGTIQGTTFQTILDAQEQGVEVTRMPTLYEEMTGRVPIHHLESDWIIRSFTDQARVSGMYLLVKRLFDILGGLAGLIIFVVLFPFIALAILIDSGLPIFYSQPRLGQGGRVFKIFKFRTMRQDSEADGLVRPTEKNDPRVTRIGNFLRVTHLDELPQFWNVLRGDMSLVGPRAERPELVQSFQKKVPFYRARLLAKPGLTGWAQINYGYVATVRDTEVKIEYDLYYIKHRSLAMDFNIILRTISTVLSRSGR